MTIGVTEIRETDYMITIDTSNMTDEQEDELYNRISCDCGDDIDSITILLDELGIEYTKYIQNEECSRLEMGRY